MIESDPIHAKLVKAIERRDRAYLWTPADAISFTPRVLPHIYGDGRALFALATINQRPRYWVIRACSTWGCGMDRETAADLDFAEMTDPGPATYVELVRPEGYYHCAIGTFD